MNTALKELLKARASVDCHCRELDLRVELAAHYNDVQLTKAEAWHAKAKAWHADAVAALQQAHLDSIATLNHKAMAEEEQKCQAFTEEFSAVLTACPLED